MRLGVVFIILFSFSAITFSESLTLRRVIANKLNMRLGPGTEYPVLGLLSIDSHTVTCQKIGKWLRIYLPKLFFVYIHEKNLDINGKKATCKNNTIARINPEKTSTKLGVIPAGTELKLKKRYGSWWTVEPPLCLTAFVKEDFLKKVRQLAQSEASLYLGGRKIMPLSKILTINKATNKKAEKTDLSNRNMFDNNSKKQHLLLEENKNVNLAKNVFRRKKTDLNKDVNIKFKTLTEKSRKLWNKFVKERSKKLDNWNFNLIEEECNQIIKTSQIVDEKDFAKIVLQRIKFLDSVKTLINAPLKRSLVVEKNMPITDKKVVASGWVVGQGKYIGRPGTHILMKGNKIIYYLIGEGIDLNACVNHRIEITDGLIDDLPPKYGCKLIRVREVKDLTK